MVKVLLRQLDTPWVWNPGPGYVVGEVMWPKKEPRMVLRRPASSWTLLCFVQSWVTMMERLQEAIEKKKWARFRMWELSVLDARESDGSEVSWSERAADFKNVELAAPLKHQVAL